MKVKRDREIYTIDEFDLMVGDILILEVGKTVRVDGILLSCGSKKEDWNKNVMVSEAQTILQDDIKNKVPVWYKNEKNSDCFILAGSTILKGEGEMLVCTVGSNCSFRVQDKEAAEKGKGNIEPSPMIRKMKKIIDWIEFVSKVVSIALAAWVSLRYLYLNGKIIGMKSGTEVEMHLTWEDLLYVLKIFSSFIGLICFLPRLKILRSLFFYLQMNSSNTNTTFRVFNYAALEEFSHLDILFIDAKAINLTKIDNRGEI